MTLKNENEIIDALYQAFNAGQPEPTLSITLSVRMENHRLIYFAYLKSNNYKFSGTGSGFTLINALIESIKSLVKMTELNPTDSKREQFFIDKVLPLLKNI